MEKKLECPSCGQISMVMKKGTSRLADGFSVNNINRWVCENCSEELFDIKTMQQIRTQQEKKTHLLCRKYNMY